MRARCITTALTAPAIASGILLGGLTLLAPAQAVPTSTITCSAATMPAVRANANRVNPLTRPAQVTGATLPMRTPVTQCR